MRFEKLLIDMELDPSMLIVYSTRWNAMYTLHIVVTRRVIEQNINAVFAKKRTLFTQNMASSIGSQVCYAVPRRY